MRHRPSSNIMDTGSWRPPSAVRVVKYSNCIRKLYEASVMLHTPGWLTGVGFVTYLTEDEAFSCSQPLL